MNFVGRGAGELALPDRPFVVGTPASHKRDTRYELPP